MSTCLSPKQWNGWHRQHNLNAERLHAQFDEILKELSLPSFYIDYLQSKIIELAKNKMEVNVAELNTKQSELSETATRLENLEEKFLQNDIDRATFKNGRHDIIRKEAFLNQRFSEMKQPVAEIWEKFSTAIASLSDLQNIYKVATTEQKQSIIGWVFDRNLSYSEGYLSNTLYSIGVFAESHVPKGEEAA